MKIYHCPRCQRHGMFWDPRVEKFVCYKTEDGGCGATIAVPKRSNYKPADITHNRVVPPQQWLRRAWDERPGQ